MVLYFYIIVFSLDLDESALCFYKYVYILLSMQVGMGIHAFD